MEITSSRAQAWLPSITVRAGGLLLALITLVPGILPAAVPGGVPRPGAPPEFHPRRILIKPRDGAAPSALLAQLHAENKARVLRTFPRLGVQVLELPGAVDIREKIEGYRRSGAVGYAEPDYEVRLSTTPNDTQYLNGSLWALNNTGQSGGTFDADLDAPEAWDIRTQATNVIVAVIDTGIRSTHEDLAANLWTNPAEIPGNGVDDDYDGFIDDVHGINAITGSGDPADDHGHGTHVAGIIGAVGNNGRGVVGVAWRVQLMACKFIGSGGSGYISDAIECINFARTHGAKVLNNSWGGGGESQALQDAIEDAGAAGIIFVAAAGNSSSDNDATPFYPAAYPSANIVTVAATTRTDWLAYFSNIGRRSVDVGAPGHEIFSTWNTADSAYTTLSGTSMAAPEVSGVLALLSAQFPLENYYQLFNRLYSSCDLKGALSNKCRTGGRVNLARALATTSSRPGNDAFASGSLISGSAFSVEGINVDATKEAGEPNHAGNAGGRSIWWGWSADRAGVATVTTAGSSFSTLLGVYTGAAVSALTLVTNNASGPNSSVTFGTLAGTTYRFVVDGQEGASGSVVLNVNHQLRPENDNFTNRIAITGSGATVTTTNALATEEAGEPLHAGLAGGKSVWWSWTPVVSGPATLTTLGSDFNTLLAVYSGTVLSSLALVASNDDSPSGGPTSRVDFTAVAGTTYQVAVDGYHGAAGTVVLNTPPANDHFANRLALAGAAAAAAGFNVLASREPLEPYHAGNPGGRSLWWTWTAPASGFASVTTIGSTFDTLLAAYTGNSVNGLAPVAANDNDPYGNFTSLISFNAVAGTTYQLAVDGAGGASGRVALQVIMGRSHMIAEVSPPAGYQNSGAYAVNKSGVAAGVFMTPAPEYRSHACIWSNASSPHQLITNASVTESLAWDINDFNQVVGYLRKPGYGSIAFLWQNGVVQELGGFESHPFSEAYSIDNAGRVLGWSQKGNTLHAFLWQNGVMSDLGAFGTDRSYAHCMNGPDLIVGWGSDINANGQWPLVWRNGVLENLPMPSGTMECGALGVNALSQIIGSFNDHATVFHSLIWQDGTIIDIGAPGASGSRMLAINNLGQVVGSDANFNHALLWQSGTWTNLESLVPAGSGWSSLFMAYKINDHGQIAGAGLRNGFTRGYVMTPLTPVTPQAVILSPTNQQVFYASQDIPFTFWMVPDAAGVTRVDVFAGAALAGTATNAPFPVVWRNVPAGQYTLSARTTIGTGATATSKPVTITVLPQPVIRCAFAAEFNPDQFVLSWPTSALGFSMETATNLRPPVVWSPLTGAVQIINGYYTTTVGVTNQQRFFRLGRPF